jgi:uncharacterized Zn finger protein (UPF0148 family)
MYVVASGPGGSGGAGSSRRLRPASPGLLFGSRRSLFKGADDRTVVFHSSPRRRGFLRRIFGGGASEDRAARIEASSLAPYRDVEPRAEEPIDPLVDGTDPEPAPSSGGGAPVVARPSDLRGIASGSCPKCHVPYLPSGTTGRWGCPFCGRHATTVGVAAVPNNPGRAGRAERTTDPQHEELLAAWMMGGPLPCPHCRAGLRHTSGGDFACPACGERVQLQELSTAPRPPVPAR